MCVIITNINLLHIYLLLSRSGRHWTSYWCLRNDSGDDTNRGRCGGSIPVIFSKFTSAVSSWFWSKIICFPNYRDTFVTIYFSSAGPPPVACQSCLRIPPIAAWCSGITVRRNWGGPSACPHRSTLNSDSTFHVWKLKSTKKAVDSVSQDKLMITS